MRMKIKVAIFSILFLLCFMLEPAVVVADRFPQGRALDFALKDISGNTVRLSDFDGMIIVLNFFTTWCPPCSREMPEFDEVAKKYNRRVKIIAVNISHELLSTVQRFSDNCDLEYVTILMDDGSANKLYGPMRAIPVTFIIDEDFNIVMRYTGMKTREELGEYIEKMLNK